MRQGQAEEAADLVPRHGHLHGLRLAAAALPEEAAVGRHALGQRQGLGPLEGRTWKKKTMVEMMWDFWVGLGGYELFKCDDPIILYYCYYYY